MKQPDRADFVRATVKKIDDHETREHWKIMLRSDMPEGAKTIMAIWSFKRKRYPDGILNKHKARLCAHGGLQQWGENYWETYAPVVNWASVRLLIVIAYIHKLDSKLIDFILAFPRANLDVPVFMKLPVGFQGKDGHRGKYVLRLNLYGLKREGFNWFHMLKQRLEAREFTQSQVDKYVFFHEKMVVLCYVDDCIIFGKSMKGIDNFVASLLEGSEGFKLTDEGSIGKYLGVKVKAMKDGTFELIQLFLIDRVLEVLGISDSKDYLKRTPVGKPLLYKDVVGVESKHSWNYRSAIGMLNYLKNSTRPDIAMAVHQCA